MKKLFSLLMMAMLAMTMVFIGCKKDDDDNGGNGNNGGGNSGGNKLSPPAWIQGSWGIVEIEELEDIELIKFTSNDMIYYGYSIQQLFPNVPGYATYTLKETKKNDLYEITITAKITGVESVSGTFSFKKGDGTYIDAAFVEEKTTVNPDDYERLYKL